MLVSIFLYKGLYNILWLMYIIGLYTILDKIMWYVLLFLTILNILFTLANKDSIC